MNRIGGQGYSSGAQLMPVQHEVLGSTPHTKKKKNAQDKQSFWSFFTFYTACSVVTGSWQCWQCYGCCLLCKPISPIVVFRTQLFYPLKIVIRMVQCCFSSQAWFFFFFFSPMILVTNWTDEKPDQIQW